MELIPNCRQSKDRAFNSELHNLVRLSQYFNELDRRLKSWLPANLHAHFHVSCIEQQTLVLHADMPAMASRLKMMLPALPPNPSVSATAQHCAESARQPPVRPASGANAGTDGAESGGIAQAVAGIAAARAAFVRTRISVYKILLSIDTKQCAKYYARSITAFMKRMTYFGRPDI